MGLEFANLEQRKGEHDVPIPLTEEELRNTADRMSKLMGQIEDAEREAKELAKEWNEHIKEQKKQLQLAAHSYRDRTRPKPTAGLWGFDWDARDTHELVTFTQDGFEAKQCQTCGTKYPETVERCAQKPEKPKFPLGQKWFVDPSSKAFFGPFPIVEDDTQATLPELADVVPFQLELVEGGDGKSSEEYETETEGVEEEDDGTGSETLPEDGGGIETGTGAEADGDPEADLGAEAAAPSVKKRGRKAKPDPDVAQLLESARAFPDVAPASVADCKQCRKPTLETSLYAGVCLFCNEAEGAPV